MKMFSHFRFLVPFLVLSPWAAAFCGAAEVLPSWKEGPMRQAVIRFVERATTTGSADFVPVPERIAAFDNDGTLWAEQPMYFQFFFAMDRIRELAPKHPEWRGTEPYASLLKGDLKGALASDEHAMLKIVLASHAGTTTEEFDGIVKQWIATARHPSTKRLYTEMVYQPMLEVLEYLRGNGFKTYIVSGGGIEFVRAWAERVYGIPPEQVIGSSLKTLYEEKDGKPVLQRLPEIDFIDDHAGKPVGIQRHIGRRPIVVFGNSDGDQKMLEYCQGGTGQRLLVLVRHDDAAREFAYGPDSKVGRFSEALLEAATLNQWNLLSMKMDWSTIYPSPAQ